MLVYNNTKFQNNKHMVWKILCGAIKKFQKDQDGRSAHFTLYENLLGTEAIENQINSAKNQLHSLSWDGKVKKGWNFDKYVLAHRDQHIILEKLTDFEYNSGIVFHPRNHQH